MDGKNCVYILRSRADGGFYVGQTKDMTERIAAHNRGSVSSTKTRRPLDLMYFETFNSKSEAMMKENRIKSVKSTSRYLEQVAQLMAPSSNG